MADSFENYHGNFDVPVVTYDDTKLGIPDVPVIFKKVNQKDIPMVNAFIYNHKGHNVHLTPDPESNGYKWNFEFLCKRYDGNEAVKIALDNNIVPVAYEIDPQKDKELARRLREYIA